VRRLAAQGCAVVATDWCAGPDAVPYAMPTVAELEALAEHPSVVPVVADVRDRDAIHSAVRSALQTWGRLDVAVAAAAVIDGGQPLWETPDDVLELLWQVDVRGVWNTAAAAIPAMLSGPDPAGCRFVAVASAAAHHGLHHLTAYNVVKHGVVGLVRGLAADLAGTGVAAVAVSPGSTRTAMLERTAALYPDASIDDLIAHQLLRRALEPDEVAATIAFCCTREAAALNGSTVHADGGFS
jgi:SDR family mycofactocin-dependent oxidoreductase